MRFAPAAAALSLVAALTASMGVGAEREADPRAAMLVIDPGYTAIFLDLAAAARSEGLQGKAIHYYREALARDPGNLAAISGEGAALVEKGAVEKAKANLAKLTSMCGEGCDETRQLAAAIQAGPRAPVLTAEAVMPEAQVTQSN